MIKLPKYEDTDWYLEEVKKLFVNQVCKKVDSNSQFKKNVHSINLAIYNLGITKKDFTKPGKRSLIEELSIADYSDLKKIKEKIDNNGGINLFYDTITFKNKAGQIQNKQVLKKDWKKIYSSYDKLIKRKVNNKIVEKLQVKTCPYCNESYINNRLQKVTAQMDHYYSRNEYPIFSISLYNLVPSCYACNHNKSDNEIGFSPFDNSINFDDIYISYIPKSFYFLYDLNDIDIVFQCKNKAFQRQLEDNLNLLGVIDAYEAHKDYVQELIKKVIIYNKDKRKELYMNYHLLFNDESEMLRIIFGNYIKQEELLKRPLSKITRDLLKEFHII